MTKSTNTYKHETKKIFIKEIIPGFFITIVSGITLFYVQNFFYWFVIGCVIVGLSMRLIKIVFFSPSVIELDEEKINVKYSFISEKNIYFSELKDFSIEKGFSTMRLFYLDNRPVFNMELHYFDKRDMKLLCDTIASIMADKYIRLTNEELDKLFDNNQYNFTITAKYNPHFIMVASILGVSTIVSFIAVVLTLLIIKPQDGLFSVIEEWALLMIPFLWIIVLLWNRLSPKRMLKLEDGVLTVSKKDKIIIILSTEEIHSFQLTYKAIYYRTLKTRKHKFINLMGFSIKDKKVINKNLELLWSDSVGKKAELYRKGIK